MGEIFAELNGTTRGNRWFDALHEHENVTLFAGPLSVSLSYKPMSHGKAFLVGLVAGLPINVPGITANATELDLYQPFTQLMQMFAG